MSKREVQVDETPASTAVHPVDQMPPVRRAVPLALQHVLIAYGGLITTPIVVGGAIGLDTPALAALIAANLVVAGLATLLQTLGIWRIGVRYPVVMGSTFTAIGPSIMIGNQYGLSALFGGTILAGLMTIVLAPFFAKLLRYFPPVVTGTIIGIIGISLLPTSADLIQGSEGEPGYNTLSSFLLAALTVGIVLAVDRFGRGTLKQVSILLALIVGTVVALFMGKADFSTVGESGAFSIPPFFGGLGAPTFVLAAIIPLLIVQFVNMIESTGDTMAVGEIVGKKTGEKEIGRTLLADGVGTAVGGVFTPFSLVTFSNNVGLAEITRMFSRHVVALAGVFLVLFGLIAPLGDVAAALPAPVLGGITVVMFGTIGVVGMRIIAKADLTDSRNIFIVGISFGFGIIPVGAPEFWSGFPDILQPVLSTSIAAGGISAFVLNLVLNVWGGKKTPPAEDPAGLADDATASSR